MEQLTIYELLALLASHWTDSGGHFMNFLAVFSAYLVAGYVLSGKLERTTLFLLSALLVAVTAMTALGQYMVQLVAIDLADEIVRRGAAMGSNAVWAARFFSGPNASLVVTVSPAVQTIACIGAIAFVHSRAGKARGETAPKVRVESDA